MLSYIVQKTKMLGIVINKTNQQNKKLILSLTQLLRSILLFIYCVTVCVARGILK